MRIFCKEKDYYDYLQDYSDDIIFDRRKFVKLTSKEILKEIPIQEYHHKVNVFQVFALRAGYYLFFFKSKIVLHNDPEHYSYYIECDFDYEIEYLGQRIDYEYKGSEILTFEWYDISAGHDKKWNRMYYDVMEVNLSNIEKGNWNFERYGKERRREPKVPLLRNTFITKYIPAELIYRGIDDYIRASKNDVDQESEGLTDVDKVINHGFDKRTSFRNIKD